jgi:propanol-preferring alcohol dehydrogenase
MDRAASSAASSSRGRAGGSMQTLRTRRKPCTWRGLAEEEPPRSAAFIVLGLGSMQAMVLNRRGGSLELTHLTERFPERGEIRVAVGACAVCRTDLHVVDGDLPPPSFPIIPGHEIVGRIDALGAGVDELRIGQRVGISWLGRTCGTCSHCTAGRETLCDRPRFTGYTRDGGFATSVIADARFAFPLGEHGCDDALAPLLCAGFIGWRALLSAGQGTHLGLYGFGAAAHILAQVARSQGRSVYVFTKHGDKATQALAAQLRVTWIGASTELPPHELDAAIIFAPDGAVVPLALRAARKGGRVVCAGLRMTDIPSLPYQLLSGERQLVGVSNLSRADGLDFLRVAATIGIVCETTRYPLQDANRALADLRARTVAGAPVIVP